MECNVLWYGAVHLLIVYSVNKKVADWTYVAIWDGSSLQFDLLLSNSHWIN